MTEAVNSEALRALFSRWSRLEDDKTAVQSDLSELFKEAKGQGFNAKAMRTAFRIARKHGEGEAERDLADRDETDAYLDMLGISASRDHAEPTPAAEPEPEVAPDPEPASAPGPTVDDLEVPHFLRRNVA